MSLPDKGGSLVSDPREGIRIIKILCSGAYAEGVCSSVSGANGTPQPWAHSIYLDWPAGMVPWAPVSKVELLGLVGPLTLVHHRSSW